MQRGTGDRRMLIDKIQKAFGTGRLNAFLLEMVAIFVGISASFAVDEWREERADVERFERYLAAIDRDATRLYSYNTASLVTYLQRADALSRLLHEDTAAMPDAQLLRLMDLVVASWVQPRHDGAFQALRGSELALPLDDTMQRLQGAYTLYGVYYGLLESYIADHNEEVSRLAGQWGMTTNPMVFAWDDAGESLVLEPRLDRPEFAAAARLIDARDAGGNVLGDAADARAFLARPETRAVLRREFDRNQQAADTLVSLKGIAENIRHTVRERLPDYRLEVRTLALVGDATPGGWAVPNGAQLTAGRSDWWAGEVTLTDGMVKFIANENWATSWGAAPDWSVIDPQATIMRYLGDPARVFPAGVGEPDGQDIPVRAGRYRVRFNIDTFEYAFEALPGR